MKLLTYQLTSITSRYKYLLLLSLFVYFWYKNISSMSLPFPSAAPDTAGGPELHPEVVSGEAEVPWGPRGLPAALRPHQQPAQEDPPWGGGAGGRGGGSWRGRRGRRGGGGDRREGAAEADVLGQGEGEGAGDRLLLSSIWPGGAATLPPGAVLSVGWLPVQPGYLPAPRPQPPSPSVQSGRPRLTVTLPVKPVFKAVRCKPTGQWTCNCSQSPGRKSHHYKTCMKQGSERPWFFFCLGINTVSNFLSQHHCHLLQMWQADCVTDVYVVVAHVKHEHIQGSLLQAPFDAPWLALGICADVLLIFYAKVWFMKYSMWHSLDCVNYNALSFSGAFIARRKTSVFDVFVQNVVFTLILQHFAALCW